MRSWSSPPNHNSPCPVTHTEVAAWAVRPSESVAVTTSSTSPGWVKLTSQSNKPPLSLLPLHSVPNGVCSVWLS